MYAAAAVPQQGDCINSIIQKLKFAVNRFVIVFQQTGVSFVEKKFGLCFTPKFCLIYYIKYYLLIHFLQLDSLFNSYKKQAGSSWKAEPTCIEF